MFRRHAGGGAHGGAEGAKPEMDRTVPRTGSEEIELYIRTYYSLLRSTADVQIRTLEETHASMGSSLHPDVRAAHPDISAFIYSALRLPSCITEVERVILGQSQRVFLERGIGNVEEWTPVWALARRRRSFFDGEGTLASYIGSRSDIDDILPILTAFQIEWNKLHLLLRSERAKRFLQDPVDGDAGTATLAGGIGIELEDLDRLQQVWGADFWPLLRAIARQPKRFRVRLLAGSLNEYRRATQMWWENVERACPDLAQRPAYFVSSNTHSIANLMSGFAGRQEAELLRFLEQGDGSALQSEWQAIRADEIPSSRENFLYYLLKTYEEGPHGEALKAARLEAERTVGFQRILSEHSFDVEVQVLRLDQLNPERLDPRLRRADLDLLQQSEAVIINIDYPLGMAAYEILSYVATRLGSIRGIYVMGKAATLNGVIGDVMIPSVVHDEQSQNTYLFENCFTAADVVDELIYGSVLDNQKSVSVRGTFLQTPRYMNVFYREGYTDIEMEAGPYLSAIYELHRPKLHPTNEIVDLHGLPFDLGLLHYASDTPMGKGRNLGAGSLSYYGMDPTYATSVAVLRRILDIELAAIRSRQGALATAQS